MKKLLRVFLLALCICLTVSTVPEKVSAARPLESGYCGDHVLWSYCEDGELKFAGYGEMYDYTTGNTPWADYQFQINRITVAEGITSIGDNAFWWIQNATSVTLPSTLESIGKDAFRNCYAIQGLVIPEGVVSIGSNAFYFAQSITELSLPSTLESIGANAFYGCSDLKTITFSGVPEIGSAAFEFCGSLQKVSFAEGVTEIPAGLFKDCVSLQEVSLPGTVTSIGDGAFEGTALKAIDLPSGVTSIGASAFRETHIASLEVPGTVESIGSSAFYGCASLTEVVIEDGVKILGENVFMNCSALVHASVPDSVTTMGSRCFSGCTVLEAFSIPTGIGSIHAQTFYNCDSLTQMTIPANISYMHSNAFSDCGSLTQVTYLGDAPSADLLVFSSTNAKGFYPANNPTWTADARGEIGMRYWLPYYTANIVTEPKTSYAQLGKTVKVSFTAEGSGLTYQWYVKNAGAAKYSKSSVTSEIYSVKMTEKVKDRLVYCIVTDQYGNTARTKTVRLRMAATVTDQSKTTYTKQGSTAKASVTAMGDGLTYQWYVKNVGAAKYSKSSNTSAVYSCKMSSSSKDRLVYCVVTDQYGKTARSETVRLRMAATITVQPQSVSAAEGAQAKVTLSAVGDGLTYTWYFKEAGTEKFCKTSTFTGPSYYVAMTKARDGRQVYCVVTDKYGKKTKSNIVTLTMK